MFGVGLVSVSFRPLSPAEIVSLCTENGLSYIEWGSDVHAPHDNLERLKEIADLQAANNIRCSSYGTYFKLGETPIQELPRYISAAKILGTQVLRIWCGNKDYELLTDTQRAVILDEAKTAARIAEESGVTLCMECHNNTFTNCLDGALTLMKKVDSPAFRMFWQPNQYRSDEENLEYAEAIAKYTVNVHVFEWKGQNRYSLENGIELWKKYLSYFKGDEILLLEFMPDDSPLSLPREVKALKEIVASLSTSQQ